MMLQTIVTVSLLLMLLLIIIFLFFLFKPWRYFFPSPSRSSIKDELERPLVVDDDVNVSYNQIQSNEFHRDYDLEGACYTNEPHFRSPRFHGLVHKQRVPVPSLSPNSHLPQQGDTLVLDVVSEDVDVGQTLKLSPSQFAEIQKQCTPNFQNDRLQDVVQRDISGPMVGRSGSGLRPQVNLTCMSGVQIPGVTTLGRALNNIHPGPMVNFTAMFVEIPIKEPKNMRNISTYLSFRSAGSCLTLEVISGPSRGLCCSVQSTNPSRLPLTLGRLPPIDLLITDSEVSGKHALIKWNLDKVKWELVDMGSLNGTLLNSQPINHPDTGSRNWGDPINLANGDIITLGTTSKVMVHITSQNQHHIPFGVGMASDPMSMRRGGKKLPMEDVCYCQWPLPGLDQFGLFGICDGHGGDGAAKSASKLFPEIVASILSDSSKRESVLSLCDASDILRDAFSQTEACMNHYYEGCTATVLLVWADGDQNFFAQCANVGDSACVMSVNGKQIKMTEDHKITNYSERLRIEEAGDPLKDGETRLYGINLARMLGDKFLKQQDSRFSSEPYISQVVHIDRASRAFAVLASDGLWDVISMKKAIHLVLQMRERYYTERDNSAENMASFLLSEAKTLRTKDNTSVIFLDFDSLNRFSCKVES